MGTSWTKTVLLIWTERNVSENAGTFRQLDRETDISSFARYLYYFRGFLWAGACLFFMTSWQGDIHFVSLESYEDTKATLERGDKFSSWDVRILRTVKSQWGKRKKRFRSACRSSILLNWAWERKQILSYDMQWLSIVLVLYFSSFEIWIFHFFWQHFSIILLLVELV